MCKDECTCEVKCPICQELIDKHGGLYPNQETIKAIEEVRNGKTKTFNSVEELFNELHK
jgi:antitoxin component of RelBE/YafQ-DinJ toxin-antitoxin module